MSDDAHDILGGSTSSHIPRRQAALPSTNLTNVDKKVSNTGRYARNVSFPIKVVKRPEHLRRPAGMHRELFNLFVHQGKDSNKGLTWYNSLEIECKLSYLSFMPDKIDSLMPTNTKRGYTVVKAQVFFVSSTFYAYIF